MNEIKGDFTFLNKRHDELIREWKKKIKRKGDYWWRKVEAWTGDGDYSPADEGEAPKGAIW